MSSLFLMFHQKTLITILLAAIAVTSCSSPKPAGYSIADSKAYEASLFRQSCAICHGAEGEGRTLSNGTRVPSLRQGEFKFKTEAEISKQISQGGNGMVPFRSQLTEREIKLLTDFILNDLRK
jgi:mono/diheme cytochrome c family protein